MVTSLALIRLLQLASPNLPTGGFSYSQGLEYAVESAVVTNETETMIWIKGQLFTTLQYNDLPLLKRLYDACVDHNLQQYQYWTQQLMSVRDTAELRLEEQQRGQAMAKLILHYWPDLDLAWLKSIQTSYLAGFAALGRHWEIPAQSLMTGYAFSWLEAIMVASMKLVPLGQQSGQNILLELGKILPPIVHKAFTLTTDELFASHPLASIMSSCHETQYSRLFRS